MSKFGGFAVWAIPGEPLLKSGTREQGAHIVPGIFPAKKIILPWLTRTLPGNGTLLKTKN
jgi:hypothetical protein